MTWPTIFDNKLNEYNAMPLPGQQLAAAHANSLLEHKLNLDFKAPAGYQRLTGIMASMGHSTNNIETMEKMMQAGMNIAFLNTSFGQRDEHVETIKMLRQAAKNHSVMMGKNYPLAIAIRLSGKKIRTGRIAESYGETVELRKGDNIRLTPDETYRDRCSALTIYIDFMYLAEQLKKDDTILLDNESIEMKVEMISGTTLTCKVERGGFLGSYKDVFVPNVALQMPSISDKDKLNIEMAVHNQVDIVIPSFVNTPSIIAELRQLLGDKGKKIMIMANIQTTEGYNNFTDILEVVDAILITRQELGSDITPKKLVVAQKNMIARANQANIAVCISTNILSSMRFFCHPLRAELLDVANCIIDGVDCLALCAETAVGLYPVETVACLANACKEAEACIWSKQIFLDFVDKTPMPSGQVSSVAMAAVLAAQRCLASAMILITTTGKSAKMVAKFKPRCPIIAVTRYGGIARQLNLWRGIMPLIYEDTPDSDWSLDLENRINFGLKFAMERGFVRIGDPILVLCGWKHGSGSADTVRIIYAPKDMT